MIAYPHCDSEVIHSPSSCTYCDNRPDLQDDRARSGYNFTGESKLGKLPCPHDARMAKAGPSRRPWPGNLPKSAPASVTPHGHSWAPVVDVSLVCTKCNKRFILIPKLIIPPCSVPDEVEVSYAGYARVPKKQLSSDYNDICPRCQAPAYRGFSSLECSKGCK